MRTWALCRVLLNIKKKQKTKKQPTYFVDVGCSVSRQGLTFVVALVLLHMSGLLMEKYEEKNI